MKTFFIFLLAASSPQFSFAQDAASDAKNFEKIFLEQVRKSHPGASEQQIRQTHFLPDSALLEAVQSPSLDQAMDKTRSTNLPNLAKSTGTSEPIVAPAAAESSDPKLTMVVVPGVFAEFIKNRAFEEVFEKPSAAQDEFKAKVAEAGAKDAVPFTKDFAPGKSRADFATDLPLDQVMNVGEMDVNGKRVKVVLLGTPFGSLESLGDSKDRATVFNRRLEKYLAITDQQNLAFVGYSRGTVTGLEMLAQAKAEGKPWVKNVKGMVSLSGVVWGSCLADDAIHNPDSSLNKIIQDLLATSAALELIPENASRGETALIAARNAKRFAGFSARAAAAKIKDSVRNGLSLPSIAAIKSMAQVDPTSIGGIVKSMVGQLGLDHPAADYNKNIERFRYFTGALLASTKELTSDARNEWWKTHEIPKNPTYYSIPAAMANPDGKDAPALEKQLFQNPLSYGNGSYDDISLLGNRKEYERICGTKMNDSQVSVTQATFLPKVIEGLNSKNDDIKTKFLGVAGTHHWGMALREVNKMKGGQTNGFPREALLQSLAEQILQDQGYQPASSAPSEPNEANRAE